MGNKSSRTVNCRKHMSKMNAEEMAICELRYHPDGFHDPTTTPNSPPKDTSDGKTLLRFTIGSHEHINMGGSLPSIAIFNELGYRIGQVESKVDNLVQGSFRDVFIAHKPSQANVRASYLSLVSGRYPVCIVSVALVYPDGTQNVFTGSDLDRCSPRIHTEQSRTFVGSTQEQPKCFMLDGTASSAKGVYGLSLHLPDLVWTKVRAEAFNKNKELACSPSPRFWPYWESGENHRKIGERIFIFNPPLEYDPKTGFDKDPMRPMNWGKLPRSNKDSSDPEVPHRYARRWPQYSNMTTSEYEASEYWNTLVSPSTEDQIEEKRIRSQAPALVISTDAISAIKKCQWGEWEQTDYVSLSERVYCDMQSRSMLPFCGEQRLTDCWDAQTQTLRSSPGPQTFQAELLTTANITIPNSTWAATGPLYGYSYGSVNLIS